MNHRRFTLPPNNTLITKQVFPNHFQDLYNISIPASSIPHSFDSRKKWSFTQEGWDNGTLGPFNQGQCGSCWAFATTECLQWKISIHSGSVIPRLSQQYLVDNLLTIPLSQRTKCVGQSFINQNPTLKSLIHDDMMWQMNGCNGSSTMAPVCFTVENFIPTDEDYPYVSGGGSSSGRHPPTILPQHGVKGALARGVSAAEGVIGGGPSDIIRMQQAIMVGGPIVCAFNVHEDFMEYWTCGYTKGDQSDERFVYKTNTNTPIDGGHAVLAIGWGVTSKGTRYWIVQNSWGKWDNQLLYQNPCSGFSEELHDGSPVDQGLFYIQFNDASGFENQSTAIYVDENQAKCYAQNILGGGSKDCSLITPAPPPVVQDLLSERKSLLEGYGNIVLSHTDNKTLVIVLVIIIVILIAYIIA